MSAWNVFSNEAEYEQRYEEQEKAKTALGYQFNKVNEYNIDNECQFNKMFTKAEGETQTMKEKLYRYVKKYCYNRTACHIDLDMSLPFFEDLSCKCRDRIAQKDTSNHIALFY